MIFIRFNAFKKFKTFRVFELRIINVSFILTFMKIILHNLLSLYIFPFKIIYYSQIFSNVFEILI